jgi:haloalkane dehalogenase
MMPIMGESKHVIALDLPGYGLSDKPLDVRYGFTFFEEIIEGFLDELKIEKIDLVVHDIGGPIGVMWALRHPDRISRLALLNTLVYPEMSWMVKLFGLSLRMPMVNAWLSGPGGQKFSLKLGVCNKENITAEVMEGYTAPFGTKEARIGLLKAAQGLSLRGFREMGERMSEFEIPVRIIYGEKDRILPDVAKTMSRVKEDLPQAEITSLPDCGHFLQEDDPETIAKLLAEFLNG